MLSRFFSFSILIATGALLDVSRGCGFWGPPMRVGSPPELVKLVLTA